MMSIQLSENRHHKLPPLQFHIYKHTDLSTCDQSLLTLKTQAAHSFERFLPKENFCHVKLTQGQALRAF